MASVTFTYGMFLHDGTDLEDYIAVGRRDPSYSTSPQGSVQISASGQRRWTSRPGRIESYSVTVRSQTASDRLWVENHQGVLVLYRDKRGRVASGIITGVQISDLTGGIADITFTFEPVDV